MIDGMIVGISMSKTYLDPTIISKGKVFVYSQMRSIGSPTFKHTNPIFNVTLMQNQSESVVCGTVLKK